MEKALEGLDIKPDPDVVVGIGSNDDAGVYRLGKELALVQTLDFITAIGDGSPYTFGQIAAANSLSDVWAMGGRPVTAMSIVCFPSEKLDIFVLRQIMQGALERLNEAGVALVGGHSVRDNELKFGLSVTGVIRPEAVIANNTACIGDSLILTKPLGSGILVTALKAGLLDEALSRKVIDIMIRLNKQASEAMVKTGVTACTDITGFGLIGHAVEMAVGSRVAIEIETGRVPVLDRVIEFSRMGIIPARLYDNLNFYLCRVEGELKNNEEWMSILSDPQTSGGLLISVDCRKAEQLLAAIRLGGDKDAAIIGKVIEGKKGHIYLR